MSLGTLYRSTEHRVAWNGMLRCPASHTQKVAHLNTSQYTTFARKGSPVFSYNLFIPFLPAWQGVAILLFIDGSSSLSLPTPGVDLLLMWSLQFNLSMRTYEKDIKTFSTRLMRRAQQREIPSSDHMKFTVRIVCSRSLNMVQYKRFGISPWNAWKRPI